MYRGPLLWNCIGRGIEAGDHNRRTFPTFVLLAAVVGWFKEMGDDSRHRTDVKAGAVFHGYISSNRIDDYLLVIPRLRANGASRSSCLVHEDSTRCVSYTLQLLPPAEKSLRLGRAIA